MKDKQEILNNKQLTILDVSEVINLEWGVVASWTNPIDRKQYFIVFSTGFGWEHLSISHRNKTPDWDTMCQVKDMFWREDEACMQLHPKKEDYINNHPYCLHIWKPIKEELGVEIPLPPSILVGIKNK